MQIAGAGRERIDGNEKLLEELAVGRVRPREGPTDRRRLTEIRPAPVWAGPVDVVFFDCHKQESFAKGAMRRQRIIKNRFLIKRQTRAPVGSLAGTSRFGQQKPAGSRQRVLLRTMKAFS